MLKSQWLSSKVNHNPSLARARGMLCFTQSFRDLAPFLSCPFLLPGSLHFALCSQLANGERGGCKGQCRSRSRSAGSHLCSGLLAISQMFSPVWKCASRKKMSGALWTRASSLPHRCLCLSPLKGPCQGRSGAYHVSAQRPSPGRYSVQDV